MLHLDTAKEMPRYFIFWNEALWGDCPFPATYHSPRRTLT